MQDNRAVSAFLKHCDDWKPKIRVMAGDLFDLRPLRRGASEDERRESMRSDISAGKRFLSEFRPDYLLQGNHDYRAWDLAQNGKGIEQDFALQATQDVEAQCARLKCKMLPYHKRDGVLRLGHLKILHGFYCGIYAPRQHANTYGACVFGHTHTIAEFSIPGLERRVARSIGCLCRLDHEYNSRQPETLKQAHGWAYGAINDKTGDYFVQQAEMIGDKFIVTKEFQEL